MESNSALNGLKILVVDDDDDTCKLIVLTLELYAAQVVAVRSVREALSLFTSFQPDCIISDIAIPSEDGYSLIRKIRAFDADEGGQVPAIAMSAYGREVDQQRTWAAGFQAYLTKPIEPDRLLEAILALIAPEAGNLRWLPSHMA